MTLTFYMFQTPVEPIVFDLVDERGFARDLSAYDGAAVLFENPDGGGNKEYDAQILDASKGTVTFEYEEWSYFLTEGSYKLQVKLTRGDRADYSEVFPVSVKKGLEN